jgi:tRNA-dihydrouridine synthase B
MMTPMQFGSWTFETPLVLAPMAGVSDRVFRAICIRHGASWAPSEMTSADLELRNTEQTRRRLDLRGEASPRIVQIAGADCMAMADAAREAVDAGAQSIDINMGCPAKRVCNRLAGSALLRDEALVEQILRAVVSAVNVPVTLKTRTGWSPAERNALRIARIAEDAGIALLTLHGRTRACAYQGDAEYDTIAAVKAAVSIPVIANGDITTPAKVRAVLAHTGADGVMIGRAAQGDPWLFNRVRHFLKTGQELPAPALAEVRTTMRDHVQALHEFYGQTLGLRIARKHIGWYARWFPHGQSLRALFNAIDNAEAQLAFLDRDMQRQHGEAA